MQSSRCSNMQHVASQCNLWTLLSCLLFQLFCTILSCAAMTTTMQSLPRALEATEQLRRPRAAQCQTKTSTTATATGYEKVELLHRLLVQQQLQQLEQRRLLRLELARRRRRLEFELSN
ncbi:hypothetical protein AWZ03_010868 [Drosophila navojoa]|uniref:Corticotropin-releasing factor domain-containing protein n=1 Tax=Drosophila navojoa TaxID=7232 RepID=A0A484B340_DRONA|nr:hypothetical protein AWZ03_010868 [Drosophila navojoa]